MVQIPAHGHLIKVNRRYVVTIDKRAKVRIHPTDLFVGDLFDLELRHWNGFARIADEQTRAFRYIADSKHADAVLRRIKPRVKIAMRLISQLAIRLGGSPASVELEAGPIRAERAVIAGYLVTDVDLPLRNRGERHLARVWIIAVVKKSRVVSGEDQPTSEIGRPISVHFDILAKSRRHLSQVRLENLPIKQRLEFPYHRALLCRLASKNTSPMYLAWANSRSDQKHALS